MGGRQKRTVTPIIIIREPLNPLYHCPQLSARFSVRCNEVVFSTLIHDEINLDEANGILTNMTMVSKSVYNQHMRNIRAVKPPWFVYRMIIILRSIDDNPCVILLLLDMPAAFDTVDHSILFTWCKKMPSTSEEFILSIHCYWKGISWIFILAHLLCCS